MTVETFLQNIRKIDLVSNIEHNINSVYYTIFFEVGSSLVICSGSTNCRNSCFVVSDTTGTVNRRISYRNLLKQINQYAQSLQEQLQTSNISGIIEI